ncbi:MAG: hypothetical protein EPN70_03480 [Paraburkholderia sp.]|uniref:hypothetical protein n=1 Tax=Paraburkholderia sp. TaxID=1926495 RepID=UPI0012047BD9|nr:hypothetical protein [Paraburkholderia sp.]TAM07246.1 MAG: hypothetical protein EPN70_03480 [Paraburkholderia sp.]TAM32615.1 MAG: hypothetical protein EPN59_01580 [Paraburkholderia sp.]
MSHCKQKKPGKQHLYRQDGMWRLDDATHRYATLVITVREAIAKGVSWRKYEEVDVKWQM